MSADILYLTRAVLSPASRNIAALLRQASRADAGHSLIWSLFEQQEGGPARFLFRETEPGRRWLLLAGGADAIHRPLDPGDAGIPARPRRRQPGALRCAPTRRSASRRTCGMRTAAACAATGPMP
ncbi:type I-E CRISPR-associated protein Cas6/Cse3/CasE [Hankyongella ginsenosidimutans]|uniref:Type I-E CRISPR-associated protein Cas6/Cse3/CasE n=1 Tax=Hankyongella ginsenosidimutans TaxID=1763828 RepID=A0A4D7C9B0_9SPHN|nr:type I-E CRISPR-associated protein Cas6/Cse3/CasE [Hankyongella ginsenosidimutans]QCI80328.1 type I-E CRISPR-associated protein Cas6/Cse3/CasE [Hankyongella ginsenosidimutans]